MLIIMTEKLFLRIPRVAGKIERFYKNIVEGNLENVVVVISMSFLVTQYLYK